MSGPFGSHQWMYASGGFYGFDIESSLRFNDDDSADLRWTPDSAGNRKTWTVSFWMKDSAKTSGDNQIFYAGTASNNVAAIYRGGSNGTLNFYNYAGGVIQWNIVTNQVFRDPSAWYHIVAAVDTTQATDSNRIKIYVNGEQVTSLGTTTYPSQNTDGLFNNNNTHYLGSNRGTSFFDGYLAEVNFIDGTALTADSFGETKEGIWIPKDPTGLTYGTNGFRLSFADDAEVEAFNTVLWRGDGTTKQSVTGMGFQPDLVWAKQRSSGNSHILFDAVRGFGSGKGLQSQNTAAEGTNDPSYGFVSSADSDGFTVNEGTVGDDYVNASGQTYVAWCWDAGANNTITGHSSVIYQGTGSTSQRISGFPFSPDLVWIKCRGAAENHNLMDTVRGWGKRLKTNNTNAEETFSGGGFYPDGFAPETTSDDQNKDATTFVAWGWDAGDSDPVSNTDGSITSTVKASTTNGFSIVSWTGNGTAGATIGHGLGAVPSFIIVKNRGTSGTENRAWTIYHSALGATKYLEFSTSAADTATNRWNDTAPTSSVFTVGDGSNGNENGDGHIAYCWADVTGKQKFNSYTGTGSSGLSVNLGFRPGLVMIKRVTAAGFNLDWPMIDGSRDPFTQGSQLRANTSDAENTLSNFIEYTSTGFTINTTDGGWNANGETYVYMAWAGSYSDFITDVNTTGDITSRVKANPTYGFSVVSYDGVASADSSTNSGSAWGIGHGLGATPQWVIYKQRTSSNPWAVYHSAVGATKYLALNTTAAAATEQVAFRDTAPTSTVINVGGWDVVNRTGHSYIAYCWSEVSGYSKFGSYTGNGSSTGPTVTLGFQPAWVIIKKTDGSGVDGWFIIDNTRDTDNVANKRLAANSSDAEGTDLQLATFSSTGFQITYNGQAVNQSGTTYIYAAFADTRDAAFWLDSSGNDNDFQHINLDHNDTVSDSPTNNFCTMNPIAKFGTPSAFTLADGNLDLTFTSSSGNDSAVGTMGVSSGKFYYEVELVSHADDANAGFTTAEALATETNTDGAAYYKSIGFQRGDRGVVWGSEPSPTQRFNALQNGDVVGFALDLDANKLYIHVNGSDSPVATLDVPTDKGDTFIPCCGDDGGDAGQFRFNFGQQPFKYGPPE